MPFLPPNDRPNEPSPIGTIAPSYKLAVEELLKTEREKFEQQRSEVASIIKEFEKQLEQSRKAREVMLEAIRQIQIENQKFRAQNQRFKLDNQQFKRDHEQFKLDNQQFKRDHEQFKLQNQQFKRDHEQFKLQNQQFKRDHEQFKLQNQQFKRDHEQFKLQNQHFPIGKPNLETEIDEREQRVEKLKGTADQLKQERCDVTGIMEALGGEGSDKDDAKVKEGTTSSDEMAVDLDSANSATSNTPLHRNKDLENIGVKITILCAFVGRLNAQIQAAILNEEENKKERF